MASVPREGASNGDLVRWAFDRLNAHDIDSLRQFWTAETVERFPDRTARGTGEITQYFKEVLAAISQFHMEVIAVVESGEEVFVRWRLTGIHVGELVGIAPTGKALEIDGVDHFVLRDGKVVSNFVIFDQMQYARQMGMMPPEGSPADRAVKRAFNARTKVMARLGR